jgi:hypothetical protein
MAFDLPLATAQNAVQAVVTQRRSGAKRADRLERMGTKPVPSLRAVLSDVKQIFDRRHSMRRAHLCHQQLANITIAHLTSRLRNCEAAELGMLRSWSIVALMASDRNVNRMQ